MKVLKHPSYRVRKCVMDQFTVRRAAVQDIPLILLHRQKMYENMGEDTPEMIQKAVESFLEWVPSQIENETYIGWIGMVDGVAVASVGMFLYPWTPSWKPRFRAYVLNVYTEPDYRRRGIAKQLMQTLIEFAREKEVEAITLAASDAGMPLYRELGFESFPEDYLILRLWM